MDPTTTLKTIWNYGRPTLIRWLAGAVLWIAVHYGIKLEAPETVQVWATSTVDQVAPFVIAGVSALWSWFEKKTLHEAPPPSLQPVAPKA